MGTAAMKSDNALEYQRSNYGIMAYWGPRLESPDELAGRLLRTLELMRKSNLLFREWFLVHEDNGVPVNGLDRRDLAELIAQHVCRGDDEEPQPERGYFFTLLNMGERSPRSACLSLRSGNTISENYLINTVAFSTSEFVPQDATLFTPELFRQVLLTLVSCWNPTWCATGSSELLRLSPSIQQTGTPKIGLAWMTYLGPFLAPLVTPPRSALVERTAEGGLLMIATEERFSVANPRHMKVAREIDAALAPVNALPWPPDAVPKDPSRRH
jgi:hypothetical protein